MGRKQHRHGSVHSGRVQKPSISESINTDDVIQASQAVATKVAYSRYTTGKRGWLEWTAAQGCSSTGLDEHAAKRVAEYMYYRTDAFTLMGSTASQLLAAVAQYYTSNTSCGESEWTVVAPTGGATSTSGNPVNSSMMKKARDAHKKALVRAGNASSDSVDVIEPVHIRTFFSMYLSGRDLAYQLGPNFFQKKYYSLTPWPTTVKLDPRTPGFIFCLVKEVGGRVRFYEKEPMSGDALVALMRKFYQPCGVLDAMELATHSAKRSGVQLYEALHQTPSWIMEKGGWTDPASFMRYRALCNRPEQRFAMTRPESW
ncbi:hypothetical protein I4F81_010665 [Pyropia yezoensis]|uniref:Uncharacterized protein n=1 Tax=Pyropia yezoensis TaxID=2788 RepID=A0ACC3CD26_PYRYE|nr:hypothetical protein I4F81_010665 [Neopyropia yezoensis]